MTLPSDKRRGIDAKDSAVLEEDAVEILNRELQEQPRFCTARS
jgi:hypothetical protein